jgi:PhnB protein
MANRPPNTQGVVPYLSYQNGKDAIDFLAKAFGFEVRGVLPGPGQSVMHAELGIGDSVVYLGTPDGYEPKRALKDRNAAVLVYVDDVDAHCARAREAGAKITSEPADMFYGDRVYNATDLEGQMWFFHTRVRDVSFEEMNAAMASMPARPETSAPPATKKRAAKPAMARAPKAKPKKKAARKK